MKKKRNRLRRRAVTPGRHNMEAHVEFFSFWFFLAVGAAGLFTLLSVGAWAGSRASERRELYKNELIKKLAEQPPDAAERVMQFMREEEERKIQRRRADARAAWRLGGVILIVVGLILTVFLQQIAPGEPVWIIGVFPLGIGGVLLAFSLFNRPA